MRVSSARWTLASFHPLGITSSSSWVCTSDALAKKRAQHRQAGSGGGRAQGPGDNACFCTLRAQETLSMNGKRSDGQKLRTGLACAPAPERNLTDRILARTITDLDEIALAVSAPGCHLTSAPTHNTAQPVPTRQPAVSPHSRRRPSRVHSS